jgi:hypothetical protein
MPTTVTGTFGDPDSDEPGFTGGGQTHSSSGVVGVHTTPRASPDHNVLAFTLNDLDTGAESARLDSSSMNAGAIDCRARSRADAG